MFEECIRLFSEYQRAKEKDPGLNPSAAIEFTRRIEQLEYFLAEVRTRVDVVTGWQARYTQRMATASRALEDRGLAWNDHWPEDIEAEFDAAPEEQDFSKVRFEIETLTEAFYFVAGRLRELLKERPRYFPGLGDLPYEGAARVRDKLLEHYRPDAEAPHGVGHAFAFGGSQGPVIRLEQSSELDPGLYTNAEKLARDLENKLRAALSPK